MLAGPGVKGRMPEAVEAIPAGVKADALFFLHTFRQAKEWKPTNEAEGAAGGVRVRGALRRRQDGGGPGASTAAASATGCGPSRRACRRRPWRGRRPLTKDAGRSAVVYQMQWTNPRPEVEIREYRHPLRPEGGQPVRGAGGAGDHGGDGGEVSGGAARPERI